ncbi:MAG: dehydratase [Rhodobacteraceae bacterium]|nr:MAG: dehydratase [Paracoccaceae bacterium]
MKYLEDFFVGQTFSFKTAPVSKDDIIEFARRWDPQPLHMDEAHATKIHGGLIASGFQTMLLVFEPVMKELMVGVANIGGAGFDNLRWLRPLRPDQPLDVTIKINTVRPSRSKPDRGILHYTLTARGLSGEAVLSTDVPVMIKRRPGDDNA